MYAYVDRPVESLSNNGRFLLWAMRGWTHAATVGRCPPQAIRCGFAGVGALGALPDFHVAMALLASDAVDTIELAPLACGRIAEGEAILLGLWHDLASWQEACARATLAMLASADSVTPIARAMEAAIVRLTLAGFNLSSLSPQMKHQDN